MDEPIEKTLHERSLSVDLELIVRPEVLQLLMSNGVTEDVLSDRLYSVIHHPALRDLIPPTSELCLTLLTDQEIHELNRDYRAKDRPTDVLSFALLEGEQLQLPAEIAVPLGDIMISVETALAQAQRGALPRLTSAIRSESSWGLSEELSFLALHGLLHLLGYDHEDEEEAEEMEALEFQLLTPLLYGEIV